ncbi:Complement C3 [Liparis tanakae]|uniref:Complement C3 n=1 Tax=Liparis tanakae TaxID=230148 RepID=A0A4Z2EM88_9TELE|nr:Complement C3 [Liparis tanakae]
MYILTSVSPPQPSLFPESNYKENKLKRECCLDGMRETLLTYTCERRSEYISDGNDCVTAFLHCCKEMKTQRADRKEESLRLASRSVPAPGIGSSEADDEDYMDSDEIVSRTKFPESWLWTDFILPNCSEITPKCKTTSVVNNYALPDSITTWQFTGISLSRTHGICVGDPLEVIVQKDFFIDLRVPYSAVRGEQLEIKAILHNLSPDALTVRVDLMKEEHVCSAAFKRKKYRQEVDIKGESTRSVPFVVIPMKEGHFKIEVKAAVKDSAMHDGIIKTLLVVPEGVLVTSPLTISLNPSADGVDGEQVVTINSGIPRKDLVPNTWSITQISVTGYQNELVYRKGDGSYSVFTHRPSSTWLTAYVTKVFAMANSLVTVKSEHICDSVKFLNLHTQQPDGVFKEIGAILHREMTVRELV